MGVKVVHNQTWESNQISAIFRKTQVHAVLSAKIFSRNRTLAKFHGKSVKSAIFQQDQESMIFLEMKIAVLQGENSAYFVKYKKK